MQQSWSCGGGNHHFNRQQQQQQPCPPPKPLTANYGLEGAFNGDTNAGGWPQEESTSSPNGSVPHCKRCGRKGHVVRICRTPPPRFEGIYGTCGQYGHRIRYCIGNQPAPHAHIVTAPIAPPLLPPSPLPRLAAATMTSRQARVATVAAAMVPTAVVPTTMVVAVVSTAMVPTAVVPTIMAAAAAETAVPAMKWCQLDSRLAAAARVMTYHHGRREHLMTATMEVCSRQATAETVSSLRLRMGATRMKGILVVLFPLFLVVRNRVMAPCVCPTASNFRVALFSLRRVCGFCVETSWRYNRDRGQRHV